MRASEISGPNLVPLLPDEGDGLGGASPTVFGVLAVLLIGFLQGDVEKFRKMMADMDADMVKIIPCSQRMLDQTLQNALESSPPKFEQAPLGQKTAVILSGMYASEIVEVISAYKENGLPATVFAAAVPKNYDHIVRELVDEIHNDHAYVAKQGLGARAAADI